MCSCCSRKAEVGRCGAAMARHIRAPVDLHFVVLGRWAHRFADASRCVVQMNESQMCADSSASRRRAWVDLFQAFLTWRTHEVFAVKCGGGVELEEAPPLRFVGVF